MQTGDIILFEATGCCRYNPLTACIRCCTKSVYSHAGILWKNPPHLPPGLYILQSTGPELADAEDGNHILGVQIELYDNVKRSFSGNLWHIHINMSRSKVFIDNFNYAYHKVHGLPYDAIPVDWVDAAFNRHMADLQREDTFFCSALVAFMLVSVGVLPQSTPWTIVRPVDLTAPAKGTRNVNFYFSTDKPKKL